MLTLNDADNADVSAKKKMKKPLKTKTAYAIRKEHKRILMEQVEEMQKELGKLKFQLLVEHGENHKFSKRTIAENKVLYGFIQEQHLALAATEASLYSHVQRSLGTLQPTQSVIHLSKDPAERYHTLLALKECKLYDAQRYLVARSKELEPGVAFCQEERFDTANGDSCFVMFETVPFRGANTKAVFDAVLTFVRNEDTFLSDTFGTITIRQDCEIENPELAQLRLSSLTSSGAIIESNTVVFSKFVDGVGSELDSYGILAEDFVDSDELHPYQTGERVRRDMTAVVMVRALPPKAGNLPEVVATRWTYLKIHSAGSDVSQNPVKEMQESSVCWGATGHECVRQLLANTATLVLHE